MSAVTTCWSPMFWIVLAWDPLGWVHEMGWYQRMLWADWFRSIRPYWLKYHLDWVAAGLLLILALLILSWLVRRGRRPVTGQASQRRSKALANKTAAHYLATGEPMLAAQAYRSVGEDEQALQVLLGVQAWSQAGDLAEQLGQLDLAAECFEKAKDPGSAVRVLAAAGHIDRAAEIYRSQGRLVDAAEMYLKHGQPVLAAWLFREVGLYSRAAALFSEAQELILAAEVLQQLMAESRSGVTQDEAEQLLQAAASLYKAGRIRESAEMLLVAGEYEGAAMRFEELGDRPRAAECYEKIGKLRRAADATDDPAMRLLLLERLRREGQRVADREMAAALSEAGQHDKAAEAFKSLGDTDAAVEACLTAGNLAEAAMLLAERGRHAEAAAVFIDSGDLMAAREQFQLAQDIGSAAEMAHRAGQFFEAGLDYFRLQNLERAIESLQQVEGQHPHHRSASSLLGQAFAQLGDVDMALRMHRRATDGAKLDRGNLALFYHMARFLESTGQEADLFKAKEIFARILEIDYAYQDAKSRFDQIS